MEAISNWRELMSAKEELELGEKICKGGDGAEKAKQQLAEAYSPLLKKLARKYRSIGAKFGLSLDELESAGRLGLMQAVQSWIYWSGTRFGAYAWPAIERAIRKEIRGKRYSLLHLGSGFLQKVEDVRRAVQELEKEFGQSPKPYEVYKELEGILSLADVGEALKILASRSVSLNRPMHFSGDGEEDGTPIDVLPCNDKDPLEKCIQRQQSEKIIAVLQKLPVEDQDLLERHYGLGGQEEATFEEIGRELKVSKQCVEQRVSKAREKLRRLLKKRE